MTNYLATKSCQIKKDINEFESQNVQSPDLLFCNAWLFQVFSCSLVQPCKNKGESVHLVEFTFQIQVFGTIDNLSDHLSVHF